MTPARQRRAVRFLRACFARTAVLVWLGCTALPLAARADDALKPVHLRIGGHEVAVKEPALADSSETYVPLDVLSAVGAKGKLNAHADAVLVTAGTAGKPVELAVARPNGRRMIALSDLARALSADIVRNELKDDDGKPIPGSKGDTVYLLARITEIHYADGAVHVATSFPVPFHAQTRNEEQPARGYLDCVGCNLPANVHPAPLPDGDNSKERRPLRLSAAQYSIDTARITLDLARGTELPETTGAIATDGATVALVSRRSSKAIAQQPAGRNEPAAANGHDNRVAKSIDDMPIKTAQVGKSDLKPGKEDKQEDKTVAKDQGERGAVQRPGAINGDEGMPVTPPAEATPGQPSGDAPKPDNTAQTDPARAALPSRSIAFQRGGQIVEVRSVDFLPDSDAQVHIEIATSGRAGSFPHYLDNGKLVIDIPNAMLNLPDPDKMQQNFSHPLLTGIHAELIRETPPVTRITLDTPRVVGFTVNTQNDKISIDVRMPRNSGGVFADKVVVIDPGHGGHSTGAISAGVVEKNLTLAISLKLRACLEAAGAKVVMTRDRDAAVALEDRPRLANAINADLFVSVHINDVDRANSASGTITFYHQGDGSSRALAVCVQREVAAVSGLPNRGALSDGTLYASGLAVLRCSSMPAVLIEVGFINHQYDRRKMVNEDFQQHVAQGICDGLRHYVEGSPETVRRTPSSSSVKSGKDRVAQAAAQKDRDAQAVAQLDKD